jgi:hypothetical protein
MAGGGSCKRKKNAAYFRLQERTWDFIRTEYWRLENFRSQNLFSAKNNKVGRGDIRDGRIGLNEEKERWNGRPEIIHFLERWTLFQSSRSMSIPPSL